MSTIERPEPRALPPLVAGQRLDQPTFHERYEAMPPGTRAELIGGVVYMPSPLSRDHGRATIPVIVWLAHYQESTPGVEVLDNASVFLGKRAEPQPDSLIRILPACGGQTRNEGLYIAGAPELVAEVSRSTRGTDLGAKLHDYEQSGVLEYVVSALDPDEIIWHALQSGRLVAIQPDDDGLFRSRVFPGLWLDPHALLAGDTRQLRAVVDRGLATPEHAAFVERLSRAKSQG